MIGILQAKKYRTGLCSDYLTRQIVGTNIVGKLFPAAITPPTPEVPVYMIGLGTGIAPLRAVL